MAGVAQYLPVGSVSAHTHHRSSGIPTSFPLQTGALTVNGRAQDLTRPLRNKNLANNRYPAEVWNINNAARNLLEIIANAARNDDGDYPIRIYTIGMGDLVQLPPRHDAGEAGRHPEADRERHALARTPTRRSSKASTTSRRRKPT